MNRKWLGWIIFAAIAVAVIFAEERGYFGSHPTLILMFAAVIILVIQVRMGRRFPPAPAYLQTLPLGKLILIGVGLMVASFVWLVLSVFIFDSQNAKNAYWGMIPFAVLLTVGTVMAGGCLGLKVFQLVWSRLPK